MPRRCRGIRGDVGIAPYKILTTGSLHKGGFGVYHRIITTSAA